MTRLHSSWHGLALLVGAIASSAPLEAIAQTAPNTAPPPSDDFAAVCLPESPQAKQANPLRFPILAPSLPNSVAWMPIRAFTDTPVEPLMLMTASSALRQGEELYQKGDWSGAIAYFNEAIQLFPFNEKLYEQRAKAWEKLKNFSAAIADYTQAIELLPPTNVTARIERASLRLKLKDWQGAADDFTEIIARVPAETASSYYRDRCIARAALGDQPGAIADYQEYRKRIPQLVPQPKLSNFIPSATLPPTPLRLPQPIQFNRATMRPIGPPSQLAPPRLDPWPAIRPPASERVPEPEPTTPEGYFERGMRRLTQSWDSNPAAAIQDFTTLIEQQPSQATAYYYRALAHFQAKDTARAIADFNRAIDLEPTFASAYYGRGFTYFYQTRETNDLAPSLTKALEDFTRTLEIQPTSSKAYAVRSAMYHLQGNEQKAQADVDSLIWKLKTTPSQAYQYRAEALQALQQPTAAIANYDQAIALDPENSRAHHQRGQLRYQQGNCEGAKTDFNRARAIDQRNYEQRLKAYKEAGNRFMLPPVPPFFLFPPLNCSAQSPFRSTSPSSIPLSLPTRAPAPRPAKPSR